MSLYRLATVTSLFLAGFLFVTPAVFAQSSICGAYQALTETLAAQYGERAVASGTAANGRAYVEFWASEKGGTWSVITVMPNGMSCLTSAGRDFQVLPGKLAKEDDAPVT